MRQIYDVIVVGGGPQRDYVCDGCGKIRRIDFVD